MLNFEALGGTPEGGSAIPADRTDPRRVLVERERQAYLLDAVSALPERLRHVVVGYFFEERPMQELADELGVTESRISQMRAEALSCSGRDQQPARPRSGHGRAFRWPGREAQGGLLRGDIVVVRLPGPTVSPAPTVCRDQHVVYRLTLGIVTRSKGCTEPGLAVMGPLATT